MKIKRAKIFKISFLLAMKLKCIANLGKGIMSPFIGTILKMK